MSPKEYENVDIVGNVAQCSGMKPGRNELCPCGSGQKYKRCCGNKHAPFLSGTALVIVVLFVLGAVAALLISVTDDSAAPNIRRIWSAEHGHYHNAP